MRKSRFWMVTVLIVIALLATGCISGKNGIGNGGSGGEDTVDNEKLIRETLSLYAEATLNMDIEQMLEQVSDPFYSDGIHSTKEFMLIAFEIEVDDPDEHKRAVFEFFDLDVSVSGNEAVVEGKVRHTEIDEDEVKEEKILFRLQKFGPKWLITYVDFPEEPHNFPEDFKALFYEYGAAFIRQDAGAISKLYANNAVINRGDDEEGIKSRKEIEAGYEQEFKDLEHIGGVCVSYWYFEEIGENQVVFYTGLEAYIKTNDEWNEDSYYLDSEWTLQNDKGVWQIIEETSVKFD